MTDPKKEWTEADNRSLSNFLADHQTEDELDLIPAEDKLRELFDAFVQEREKHTLDMAERVRKSVLEIETLKKMVSDTSPEPQKNEGPA